MRDDLERPATLAEKAPLVKPLSYTGPLVGAPVLAQNVAHLGFRRRGRNYGCGAGRQRNLLSHRWRVKLALAGRVHLAEI